MSVAHEDPFSKDLSLRAMLCFLLIPAFLLLLLLFAKQLDALTLFDFEKS